MIVYDFIKGRISKDFASSLINSECTTCNLDDITYLYLWNQICSILQITAILLFISTIINYFLIKAN